MGHVDEYRDATPSPREGGNPRRRITLSSFTLASILLHIDNWASSRTNKKRESENIDVMTRDGNNGFLF